MRGEIYALLFSFFLMVPSSVLIKLPDIFSMPNCIEGALMMAQALNPLEILKSVNNKGTVTTHSASREDCANFLWCRHHPQTCAGGVCIELLAGHSTNYKHTVMSNAYCTQFRLIPIFSLKILLVHGSMCGIWLLQIQE